LRQSLLESLVSTRQSLSGLVVGSSDAALSLLFQTWPNAAQTCSKSGSYNTTVSTKGTVLSICFMRG